MQKSYVRIYLKIDLFHIFCFNMGLNSLFHIYRAVRQFEFCTRQERSLQIDCEIRVTGHNIDHSNHLIEDVQNFAARGGHGL